MYIESVQALPKPGGWMNNFVVVVACLLSFSSFAQEMSPQPYATGKPNEKESLEAKQKMEKAFFTISNAIDMIDVQKIADLKVDSAVTDGTVFLYEYSTENYQGQTLHTRLEATLEKLLQNDKLNWLPSYLKYLKHLANESEYIRDLSKENDTFVVSASDMNGWEIKNRRLIQILNDVESGDYLKNTPPGAVAQIQDLKNKYFN